MTPSPDVQAIRHFIKGLVFRFKHVLESTPDEFASFETGAGVRTPARIVLHMTGLLTFTADTLIGEESERLEPLTWPEEQGRFIEAAKRLDGLLAAGNLPAGTVRLEQLWQGPMNDAMTHVGQLATLRRLYGSPVERVRYWQVTMPEL